MTSQPDPAAQGAPDDHVEQLADLAELVRTGRVDLGAYTQAEMAVVLGDVPALAGVQKAVLAEAVRSLAARGVLHRVPGERSAEVVGDLGLLVALAARSVGTLEVRRGHAGPADAPWRWLISVFSESVVGVDRIDALGLHRMSLFSTRGVSEAIADRLILDEAQVPAEGSDPVPVDDDQVRDLVDSASERWQLIHRVPRRETATILTIDSYVVRVDDNRVDLLTHRPGTGGYQRLPVDSERLSDFIAALFTIR